MRRVLLLDERIRGDGTHARTWMSVTGDRVRVTDDDDGGAGGELSIAALDRVMCRYGRPLDPAIALAGEVIELPGGYRLRRLRYRAAVDVTGRDYLVWERQGEEPLAVVAAMATAALRYLTLRIAAERPQDSESSE